MTNPTSSGQPLVHVNPGDLITADWMNSLADTVNDLQARLASLEGTQPNGGVVISDLIFISPLRLGDPLEIRGQNFGYSSGAQQVSFDDIAITEFRPGSSDTRLLVTVPSFADFPEAGRNVTLVVSNGIRSAQRQLAVMPADRPVSGNLVDVLWETVTPNPILTRQAVRFGYRLRSRVGATRTFIINPVISRPELQGGIEVWDENEVRIADRQIPLGSLQEKLFFIHLPTLPDSIVDHTNFTLTVSAISGGVTGSDSRDFTVGELTTASDPTITLSVSNFSAVDDAGDPVPADGSYDTPTKTIRLRAGAFGSMELGATFEQVGTYTVSLNPSGVVNGWTKSLDTGASIVIEDNDLTGTPRRATRLIRINLQAAAGATASQVDVRVQLTGATVDERVGFQLARLV